MHPMSVNKAGMEGVDREKVSKIIAENTSASYGNFTAKQQKRVDVRVAEIQKILSSVTPSEWSRSHKETDDMVAKLEMTRDLNRYCVHIDMDAFFAAVETRDCPRLRTVPMAVGSQAMLSTSNYIARRSGVRAAMPGFIAKKLCPELEIIPGNYGKYGRESKVFAAIFAEYDDDFSMGSLDEAYIDLTDYLSNRTVSRKFARLRYGGDCVCRLPIIPPEEITELLARRAESCPKCGKERITYEDEVEFDVRRDEVVREIRFRVEQATGLTCSAGIAANFMLAKICSDLNKPNGQYELVNEYSVIMDFLQNLPIRKVCGIGRVSEAHLKACGMETVGDILDKRASLRFAFTPLSQEHFLRVALGLSGRPRESDPRRKSISVERTFTPTSEPNELKEHVQHVCEELSADIKRVHITGGRCVTLKIKLSSFDVLTRSVTLANLVTDLDGLLTAANGILVKELGQEMRLLGVRLSHLKFADEENANGKTVMDYFKPPKRVKQDENDEDEVVELVEPTSEGSSRGEPSPSDTKSESGYCVLCPICSKSLPHDDTVVNKHIDECLNRDLLRSEAAPLGRSLPVTRKLAKGKKTAAKSQKKAPAPAITSFFSRSHD